MRFNTCRFCHKAEYEADAKQEPLFKYSTRHWAHTSCGIERRGLEFLDELHDWQLRQIPVSVVVGFPGCEERLKVLTGQSV